MTEDDGALKAELKALSALRNDARERGLLNLVIVYGWSCIRISGELMERAVRRCLLEGGSQ